MRPDQQFEKRRGLRPAVFNICHRGVNYGFQYLNMTMIDIVLDATRVDGRGLAEIESSVAASRKRVNFHPQNLSQP
jgi:hypothetical protein